MSQLVTAPYFDCACSGGVEPVVSNPIMFYSAALGTPASLGLIPPIPGLGAFAAEQTGNGPVYVWNPNSATWSYLANTVLFNPLMFYDTTVGTPMSLSLVPPTQSIGALCAEKSGNGPMYVWNPSTHTWN